MSRRHISQSIEGALNNWNEEMWKHIATSNGTTVAGAKGYFEAELDKGHKFLPMGDCKGFDPLTGCPGHERGPVYECGHCGSSVDPETSLEYIKD